MKSQVFKSPLPYAALIIAHLIWGVNYVVAKFALSEFPLMSLAFLRFAFAFLLILPFLVPIKNEFKKINSSSLLKLLGIGLLMTTVHITLFYEGLTRATAIDASVLSMTTPIISLLFGWWILKEKIYILNLVGIIIGLVGVVVIIGIPLIFFGQFAGSNMVGNLLIILASLAYVMAAILSKEMLKIFSPLLITAVIFFVGMVTFAVPATADFIQNPGWISQISILGIFSFLYIVILSSVIAFFLLQWGLERIDVVKANLFQYMEPAVAATLAVPLLGERISFSFIIGTCLVVLGTYWGTFGKAEHHHYHHKSHKS